MSLWVLDTDMLTLWLRGRETVAARVAVTPPQQLAVTIVTIEEVLGGWYTQARRARGRQRQQRQLWCPGDPLVAGAARRAGHPAYRRWCEQRRGPQARYPRAGRSTFRIPAAYLGLLVTWTRGHDQLSGRCNDQGAYGVPAPDRIAPNLDPSRHAARDRDLGGPRCTGAIP